MGIMMIPEQFDQDRRRDPKRAAEARVYDVLRNLDLEGHGIYEFRHRRGGREVDFALWLNGLARFAVQVKGGRYHMDDAGRWYLERPDGRRDSVGSPLSATVDGCMEMRNGIRESTTYSTFVVGVLIFPDMARDADMEQAVRNRKHVHIVWGLDNLAQELLSIATERETITSPPEPGHSRNEWEALNGVQYRPLEGTREGAREGAREDPRDGAAAGEGEAPFASGEMPLSLGSATINIQHVNTLVIQGHPVLPEAGQAPPGL